MGLFLRYDTCYTVQHEDASPLRHASRHGGRPFLLREQR